MHPRRSSLLRAAAGVVTALLLTSSCTGAGDSAGADPTPSGSTSATPEPSPEPSPATADATPVDEPTVPQPPPVPEPPGPRPGPKGQRAFAEHVIASWAWSLQANDAAPLLTASRSRKRPCNGCRELARELRRRDREQWYVDLPPVGVDRTRLRRDGDLVVASTRVDIPESDSYFYDGSFRSSSRAHDDATFLVTMRRTEDRYVLVSFTVG